MPIDMAVSSDLVPNEYHIFSYLQYLLGGKMFMRIRRILCVSLHENVMVFFYGRGLKTLLNRQSYHIDNEDEYYIDIS